MAVDMHDLARTKRNVARMADQGAPNAEILRYVRSEGYTREQVKNFPMERARELGDQEAAEIPDDILMTGLPGAPQPGPNVISDTSVGQATGAPQPSVYEQYRAEIGDPVPPGSVPQAGRHAGMRQDAPPGGAAGGGTFKVNPALALARGDVNRFAGSIVGKGVRDLATGVVSLPFDIAEARGLKQAGDVSRAIQEHTPDIEFTGDGVPQTIAEVGSEVVQFGIPGLGAARTADKFLRGSGKIKRVLGDTLAAGGADFIAAGSNITETIGNWLGGPTEIKPDDSPLERRSKIGMEALAFQGVLAGIMKLGSKAGNALYSIIRPIVGGDAIANELAQKTLRDFAHDPEGAAQRLAESVEELSEGGYKPATGPASGDPGLLQLHKGLARKTGQEPERFSPAREFAERTEENEEAVSRQLRGVTDRPGVPEDVRTFTREEREAQLEAMEGAARHEQEALEQGALREQDRLSEAEAEVDSIVHELQTGAAGRTGAAKELDRTVRDELTRTTNRKNELAGKIDPDRSLVVDDTLLRETFDHVTAPKGPFDATPEKLRGGPAGPIMRRIENFLSPDSKKALTFGDLQDLRPEISEAIKQAQGRGQKQVVDRLLKLRGMLNQYTEQVAEEAAQTGGKQAAMAARQFLNYYRDIYVPKFKQGVGGQINEALLKGEEIAPTTMPGKFIKRRAGQQEAAQDLQRIIRGAENPAEANRAVRDYLVTDFARAAVDPRTGKLNRGALRKYLEDHRDVLREFPDIRDEIRNMARGAETALEGVQTAQAGVRRAETELQKATKEAAARLNQNVREYNKNVASLFVDNDPVAAVGQVFTGKQPARRMGELMRQVKGNQAAREGLQAAVGDYLHRTLRGGKALRTGEDVTVMAGRVLDFMRDPQKVRALRIAHGQNGVDVLRRINRQLQTTAREHKKLAAGVPTHLAREAIRPLSVALDLKFGIMRGRRYLHFAKLVRKFTGMRDIESLAEEFLTRAMLDPEVARIALMPVKGEATEKRLKAYIVNNMLTVESDADRRRGLLESQPPVR